MTDRGKDYSFKTFRHSTLNDFDNLPSIKKNRKSLLTEGNNSSKYFTRRNSKYFLSTDNNFFHFNKVLENQKHILTNPNQKYLDKKIIQLINCYKDLKFSENEKKFKIRRHSLDSNNIINTNKSNKNNKKIEINKTAPAKNYNILSKALTKVYKISEQQDKEGVKKLDEWDKNNLAQLYGNSEMIYDLLLNYYTKMDDYDKIMDLNYYKNIIKSDGQDVENIIMITNKTNNNIIKEFLNLKIKEQTYILKNSLSNSHSKFNKTLLFIKEKKLAVNLGLDNETLAEVRKIEEKSGHNYEKVINDKEKKEMLKKEELINILIKIFNKKMEKNKKEKKQSEIFEKINKIYVNYQSKIMKIQFDIDSKKELYDKIDNTEYEKEKMVEKVNLLQRIKFESEQDQKKQEIIRKELDKEMKELTEIKDEINEELEICKNEISYMKLVYNNLVKNQRNYYIDLLKKGYDVRGEGLIWVVKRLLEIQTKLEYHHFPKFLDNSHIKYIIEMANLSLEEIQLKTILKIVEKKRDDIQNTINNKVMNTIEEFSKMKNRHRASIFTLEMQKMKNSLKYGNSDSRIFDIFEKIYRKYKPIFLNRIIQKDEEIKTQKIIKEIKSSLLEGGGKTTTDNFQQLTKILNYLNNNKESKEYLEILLLIKFRLSFIYKLKESLKEEQINKFREELSLNNKNRFFNAESSLRLDLIKSALFGNKF